MKMMILLKEIKVKNNGKIWQLLTICNKIIDP
eukprot:CAMPEP_0114335530 /NCGR_PEP_ID=MMETSP0101-20121206/5117_1 /TAXON_ID=38822 ORGANISM="Pteridomonas danica, Strain PT" /NCGR_SAMPLE_ID=MMETSP0101 /ASSEMBLY_ACC=CAM_ASM_000211 /LENGTH=31 /DNA_ID= /DNA_START= /DNA_END= /DNA_ORIENTATION=